MDKHILKYITEEKDISRYKLSLLRKGAKKKYKARLINAEESFIDYPFEKIEASSLSEVRDAMSLFKTDRGEFLRRYEGSSVSKESLITEEGLSTLLNKNKFYIQIYKDILDAKIKEVNIMQSPYIQRLSGVSQDAVLTYGLDDIAGAEGAVVSKARARIQVLLYCLARFIHDKTKAISIKVSKDMDMKEFLEAEGLLDDFFSDVSRFLFKNYNNGISEVPLLINGTMGHNNFVSTIYPLSNAIDKYPGEYIFKRLLPEDKAFFTKTGRPVVKKFVERGFGILTPIRRVGNESVELLYLDVYTSNGVKLTSLLDSSFFNYSNKDYYKAISARPVWDWQRYIDNPYLEREVAGLLGVDAPMLSTSDLSIDAIYENINNCSVKGGLDLDPSSSIMIAATRSESDHIKKSLEYIRHVIVSIKNDFKLKFKVG